MKKAGRWKQEALVDASESLKVQCNATMKVEDAGMVELVDTYDSGSYAARCEGSSPFARTKKSLLLWRLYSKTKLIPFRT